MIPHSRPNLSVDDFNSVNITLKSGMISNGTINKKFKELLLETLNTEFVQLSSSGTMAFYKILLALKIKKSDEILLPDYICSSLLNPIRIIGAKAVFYDNKENSWLSSSDLILSKLTDKTKVIIVNHTFGFLFEEIKKLKNLISPEIFIIEDCCHLITPKSMLQGSLISEYSLCSFYSFNATKLITTGEGGAISTKTSWVIEELKKIEIGDELSDLNCKLGINQINNLPYFLEKRQEIAHRYITKFKDYIDLEYLNQKSIFFRFPILVENNDTFFKSKIVSYKLGVDTLLSEITNLKPLKNTDALLKKIVSVPIYPSLTKSEISYIINETLEIIRHAS